MEPERRVPARPVLPLQAHARHGSRCRVRAVHPGEQEWGEGLRWWGLLLERLLPPLALLEEAALVLKEEGFEEDEVVVLCVCMCKYTSRKQAKPDP